MSTHAQHLTDGPPPPPAARQSWPLERVLFALAGTVTLIAALLTAIVSKWFLVLAALVGINQWLYALIGWCPMSTILRRTCRMQSAIYQQSNTGASDSRLVSHR